MLSRGLNRTLRFERMEDRRVLATTLNADFNDNGTIDGPDLPIWQSGYGTVGTATRSQGDADGDMDVDGRDFF